jgi:hypothetical protein
MRSLLEPFTCTEAAARSLLGLSAGDRQ